MRSPTCTRGKQDRFGGQNFYPILPSIFSSLKISIPSYIIAGSPAEKADLEVADEILEVNGESLENSNHTDVIAHIHNVRYIIHAVMV